MKDMQLGKQSPKVCPMNTADMQLRGKAIISEVSVEVAYIYRSQRDQCESSTDHLFTWNVAKLFNEIRIMLWLTNVLADSILSSCYDP